MNIKSLIKKKLRIGVRNWKKIKQGKIKLKQYI